MTRAPAPELKIRITPSMKPAVAVWCQRFVSANLAWWDYPRIVGDDLVVNSLDVANFIKLATADDCCQMDAHRLKRAALAAFDLSLKRARTEYTKSALTTARQWAADATVGEWKGKPPTDERPAIKRLNKVPVRRGGFIATTASSD